MMRKKRAVAERITLDTNVLVYAFDQNETTKQPVANELLWRANDLGAILTTIVLGEFFHVTSRKAVVPPLRARQNLADLITLFPVVGYGTDTLETAALESVAGRLSFWDAVMLACAEEAGCTVCFSEDMADGMKLGNIIVRNPFGPKGLSNAARAIFE